MRPGEPLLITLRVKATFVYHEDLDPNYEDEGAGSLPPDDFTEWQLHCEIPLDEVEDFDGVNGAHAQYDDNEGRDRFGRAVELD